MLRSAAAAFALFAGVSAAPGHRSVLLIVVDDLRPQLGAYGLDFMYTPNIDGLAKEGALFERAYVQAAICSPTRNSFLSGRYPDKTKVWNFIDHFREEGVGSDWVALPEFFRDHGYYTQGAGKVYHGNTPPNHDQEKSWSAKWIPMARCDCGRNAKTHTFDNATCEGMDPHEFPECGDDHVTAHIVAMLEAAANATQPQFIAAGLIKPHLAFYARPEDFARYPNPKPPLSPLVAEGYPYEAWHSCLSNQLGENYSNWGHFTGIPNNMTFEQPMGAAPAAHLRQGYYASVTYTDSNVGRILAAVPDLDEWVVALIGDHGWSLGENNVWCKMTNSENAVHTPLLIRAPWAQKEAGMRVSQLAEAVDLYRTLADLSGVGEQLVEPGVDGVSLAPLLRGSDAPLRSVAKSQFPRCWTQIHNDKHGRPVPVKKNGTDAFLDRVCCADINRTEFDLMGYSVRTTEWRFTEWRAWDGVALKARWDLPANATELYDHRTAAADIFSTETVNVAADPKYESNVKMLQEQLRKAFDAPAAFDGELLV